MSVSPDQLAMARLLHQQPFEAERRLQAFVEGRLQIWCEEIARQDSAGCVHTLQSAGWYEVRDAFAIFNCDAKYRILEKVTSDAKSY